MARAARWRPGIAVQLAIAFVGVAVLAGVANFAVQRTISVTMTRVLPPAPSLPSNELGHRISDRVPDTSTDAAEFGAMLAALERLVRVVETALVVPEPEQLGRAREVASELRAGMIARYGTEGTSRVDAALRAGLDSMDLVIRRHAGFEEYSATLSRLDARIQESLNRAWKILGRVVTRQSLVALDLHFKDLRRQAELLRNEGYSAADIARLEALEAQIEAALRAGERSLTRSQGAETYAHTVEDFHQLVALRHTLVQLDTQRPPALSRFGAAIAALREELSKVPPQKPAPSAPEADTAHHRVTPISIAVPDISPAISTTQESRDDGIARSGLAWLSIGVLVLLLAVSVAAVLSILRPVRRLIAATQRVSLGEAGVRVPLGGGPELDRLAAAFNLMAVNLEAAQAVAQTYQQRLEMRVTERTRQLQHQADHDSLTQLPNRRQLFERLRQLIESAGQRAEGIGLYFLDLDNFKNINDGMGHGFGDRVLLAVAERLRNTAGTLGFAARFAGDEFTVVVEARDRDAESLRELGWALVRAFQQPLSIDRREVLVSVSVGAAFYPEHGTDAESLLRAADVAMFRAKALGRSQLSVFTPELLEAAASRFTTEQGLRLAIDRGELELVFQPEIDLATLEVEVCEALLRWRTPAGELLSPDHFLSVAEESGLIIEINDWVLRSAIKATARWRREGLHAMRIAVNVSSRQFFDASFSERVRLLLAEHDLPPQALEIELTENVLQTGASTIEGLRRLQQLGVGVALDDFGTGYSSLASLEQLPLNRVKLDRSLIAGIDSSDRCAAIAKAIIRLCCDLGMKVTAEGVERSAQLALLRNHSIHLQGYLLSRPVPEAQIREALQILPARLQALLLDCGPGTSDPRSPAGESIDAGSKLAQTG